VGGSPLGGRGWVEYSLPMSVRVVIAAALVCVSATGCGFSRMTPVPRSASQQILATEAIDRALEQFEFPDLKGKKVMVHVGPPGDAIDEEFLRTAVSVELFEEEAKVVTASEDADLVLGVLIGAMGLDIGGRFFGIEGTGGGFIPFTIPELALYRKTRTEGFAQAEFALVDHHTGELVHRSEQVIGTTWSERTVVFFVFSWRKTDTARPE